MAVLPARDDVDTAGFFEAAEQGRLVVRRCGNCDEVLHMPVGYCRHCGHLSSGASGGMNQPWADVRPIGRIYSYTVVAHQVHPEFPVPYTVILVELDDVPEVRLVGRLAGSPAVFIGQPVVARFAAGAGPAALPEWTPVQA